MRLDFNVLLIDDEVNDDDENEQLIELQKSITEHVAKKGFKAIIKTVESIRQANIQRNNRVDIFISDNNLNGKENGIDFYLAVSSDYICEFVLYTRSSTDEIVRKLADKLIEGKNPNLFSRFSFAERKNDEEWFNHIKKIIDHILSRREEINNFRGLYAQLTSKIHKKLRDKYDVYHLGFCETINKVRENGRMSDESLYSSLHRVRMIRNSLMHKDEIFCVKKGIFKIECDLYLNKVTNKVITAENFSNHTMKITKLIIYENELKKFRDEINDVYNKVMNL